MKILKITLSLILILALSGCNDTDERDGDSAANLTGTWKMVRASGGIAGTNDTFTPGTITWTFDVDAHTVAVVNNNTNEMLQDALDSGTYDYELVQSPATHMCAIILNINDMEYGCYLFTEAGLTISQAYNDGLDYDFIR